MSLNAEFEQVANQSLDEKQDQVVVQPSKNVRFVDQNDENKRVIPQSSKDILRQLEYYFSDENLSRDSHLLNLMRVSMLGIYLSIHLYLHHITPLSIYHPGLI